MVEKRQFLITNQDKRASELSLSVYSKAVPKGYEVLKVIDNSRKITIKAPSRPTGVEAEGYMASHPIQVDWGKEYAFQTTPSLKATIYKHVETGEVYVSYRGTDNMGNLLKHDTAIAILDKMHTECHDFVKEVDGFAKQNYDAYTNVGHSLGGSLATLASLLSGANAITWDSPGIGQKTIASFGQENPAWANMKTFQTLGNIVNALNADPSTRYILHGYKAKEFQSISEHHRSMLPPTISGTGGLGMRAYTAERKVKLLHPVEGINDHIQGCGDFYKYTPFDTIVNIAGQINDTVSAFFSTTSSDSKPYCTEDTFEAHFKTAKLHALLATYTAKSSKIDLLQGYKVISTLTADQNGILNHSDLLNENNTLIKKAGLDANTLLSRVFQKDNHIVISAQSTKTPKGLYSTGVKTSTAWKTKALTDWWDAVYPNGTGALLAFAEKIKKQHPTALITLTGFSQGGTLIKGVALKTGYETYVFDAPRVVDLSTAPDEFKNPQLYDNITAVTYSDRTLAGELDDNPYVKRLYLNAPFNAQLILRKSSGNKVISSDAYDKKKLSLLHNESTLLAAFEQTEHLISDWSGIKNNLLAVEQKFTPLLDSSSPAKWPSELHKVAMSSAKSILGNLLETSSLSAVGDTSAATSTSQTSSSLDSTDDASAGELALAAKVYTGKNLQSVYAALVLTQMEDVMRQNKPTTSQVRMFSDAGLRRAQFHFAFNHHIYNRELQKQINLPVVTSSLSTHAGNSYVTINHPSSGASFGFRPGGFYIGWGTGKRISRKDPISSYVFDPSQPQRSSASPAEALAALGSFAGPLGAIGGYFIGSLFGGKKKKQGIESRFINITNIGIQAKLLKYPESIINEFKKIQAYLTLVKPNLIRGKNSLHLSSGKVINTIPGFFTSSTVPTIRNEAGSSSQAVTVYHGQITALTVLLRTLTSKIDKQINSLSRHFNLHTHIPALSITLDCYISGGDYFTCSNNTHSGKVLEEEVNFQKKTSRVTGVYNLNQTKAPPEVPEESAGIIQAITAYIKLFTQYINLLNNRLLQITNKMSNHTHSLPAYKGRPNGYLYSIKPEKCYGYINWADIKRAPTVGASPAKLSMEKTALTQNITIAENGLYSLDHIIQYILFSQDYLDRLMSNNLKSCTAWFNNHRHGTPDYPNNPFMQTRRGAMTNEDPGWMYTERSCVTSEPGKKYTLPSLN